MRLTSDRITAANTGFASGGGAGGKIKFSFPIWSSENRPNAKPETVTNNVKK